MFVFYLRGAGTGIARHLLVAAYGTCPYTCEYALHSMSNLNIASWNVRGLNAAARRDMMHEILAATTVHIACLQETKMSLNDHATATYIGGYPASGPLGTRGGITIMWNENYVDLTTIVLTRHTLSADVMVRETGQRFKLTTVYGPAKLDSFPA